MAIPAGLGFALALAIHNPTYYGSAGENFPPFALLLGAALAVTAFLVMAHIPSSIGMGLHAWKWGIFNDLSSFSSGKSYW